MSESELLSGFLRELATEHSPEVFVRRALAYLVRATGVDAGALFLYAAPQQELQMVASHGLPLLIIRNLGRQRLDSPSGGLAARAGRERRPVIADDARAAAAPLCLGDRLLGAISLFASGREGLRVVERADFRTLCDLLAVLLERNQLVGERERRLQVQQTLLDLSQGVLPVADMPELSPKIVRNAVELLGGTTGCLALWEAEAGVYRVVETVGLPAGGPEWFLSPGQGLLGRPLATGQPVLAEGEEAEEATALPWPGEGTRSAIAVPLRFEGALAGVLAVGSAREAVRFTWDDVAMLASFASLVVISLANAGRFRRVRHKADQMEALLKISRRLTESLKLDAVLASVLQEAAFFLAADAGVLHLARENGELAVAATYGPPSLLSSEVTALAQAAMLRGEPGGGRTSLCVPLVTGTKRIGALTCVREHGLGFAEDDLAFLWTLASHAAMAIENARLHEEAEERSIRDPLTGLYNVRRLEARLSEEFFRAQRYRRDLSFLMLDIDHFKRFNDTYGHLSGDRVLREVADVVSGSVRSIDQVFRYGGEEICVLLPETPSHQALVVAERIRLGVAALNLTGENGQTLGRVTVSLGVASFPHEATEAHELIARADEALYQAKGQGRNRVVLARPRAAVSQAKTVTTSSRARLGR